MPKVLQNGKILLVEVLNIIEVANTPAKLNGKVRGDGMLVSNQLSTNVKKRKA